MSDMVNIIRKSFTVQFEADTERDGPKAQHPMHGRYWKSRGKIVMDHLIQEGKSGLTSWVTEMTSEC